MSTFNDLRISRYTYTNTCLTAHLFVGPETYECNSRKIGKLLVFRCVTALTSKVRYFPLSKCQLYLTELKYTMNIYHIYNTQSILLYLESKVLQSGLREKVTLLKPILAHFLLAWKILRRFFMNATFYLIFGCWWKQVFEPITAFPTFHRQQNNSFQKAFLRNSFFFSFFRLFSLACWQSMKGGWKLFL